MTNLKTDGQLTAHPAATSRSPGLASLPPAGGGDVLLRCSERCWLICRRGAWGRARARSRGYRAGWGFSRTGEGGLFPARIVAPMVLVLVPLFQFVLDLDQVFQLSRRLPVAAG